MEFTDIPTPYRTLKVLDNSLSSQVQFVPSGERLIQLLHTTAEYLKELTQSDGYIHYSLDASLGELFICPVGKHLKECFINRYSWDIETDATIAIYAFKKKTPIVVDANQSVDLNFPYLQALPCLYPRYILSIPLVNFQKRCFGVVEYYRYESRQYNGVDVKLCQFLLNNCAEALKQNESSVFFEKCNENQFLIQELLEMYAFSDIPNGSYQFLQEVVTIACDCTGAMASAIFIKQQDQFVKICSTDDTVIFTEDKSNREIGTIIRSIVDNRFDAKVMGREIHGLIKACNKNAYAQFLVIDQQILQSIAKMCTIWCIIEYMSGYLNKQKTSNDNFMDLINLQLQNAGDFNKKLKVLTPTATAMLNSWEYSLPINASHNRLSSDVVVIIGCIKGQLPIEDEALRDFVVMVEQCHPNNESQNFLQSVICIQGLYRLLHSCSDVATNLEALAMVIALLCRNIVVNNEKTYASSIFGRYNYYAPELIRFEVLKFLIEETKLLKQLPTNDQDQVLCLIKECLIDVNLTRFKTNSLALGNYIKELSTDDLDCKEDPQLRYLIRSTLPGFGVTLGYLKSEEFRVLFPNFTFFKQFEKEKLTYVDIIMIIIPF